jgi:predicted MFS family arabinose efflux permease
MSDINKKGYSKAYLNYVIFVMFVLNAVNLADRNVLGIVLEPIKLEFGLTDLHMGLLTGFAFAVFYALVGLPIARWADHGVRKNIMALAIAVCGIMTAFCGMAQGFFTLLFSRIGVGAGEAGLIPTAQSMISDYFDEKKRGMPMGILMAGGMFGTILCIMIGGYLNHAYGWRTAVIAMGLPGLVVSIIAHMTLREPERGGQDSSKAKPVALSIKEALVAIFKIKTLVLVIFATAIGVFAFYGVAQWGAAFFIRSHGMNTAQVGKAFGLAFGGGALLGNLLGGKLGDILAKSDDRWHLWLSIIAYLVCIPFMALAYDATSQQAALIFMFFGVTMALIPVGPQFAMMMLLVPASIRATTAAVGLFFSSVIGIGLGPTIVGLISDNLTSIYGKEALRHALFYSSFATVIAAILMLLAVRTMPGDLKRLRVDSTNN